MIVSKTLIPNKEWILKNNEEKIGSIIKSKKGYSFYKKGLSLPLKNIKDVKENFGVELTNDVKNKSVQEIENYSIYDYPCKSKPYSPIYNLKKRLPLFVKSSKSKSQYCAGYYVIKFRNNWVKSLCPKLITLERYPYYGPYKTEQEVKIVLNTVNKNETVKHDSD